jgi:hypothetical protein
VVLLVCLRDASNRVAVPLGRRTASRVSVGPRPRPVKAPARVGLGLNVATVPFITSPSSADTFESGVCGRHALVEILQAQVVQIRHRPALRPASGQPRGSTGQPSASKLAAVRTVRRLLAPLTRHSRSSTAASGPLPSSRYRKLGLAVERPPVEAAPPAGPVAGLRGARTGIVGLGPAAARVALVYPRAGLEADLPGPARRLPGQVCHRPWPGCRAPTNPPRGRARPSRSPMALLHGTPRRQACRGRFMPVRAGGGPGRS